MFKNNDVFAKGEIERESSRTKRDQTSVTYNREDSANSSSAKTNENPKESTRPIETSRNTRTPVYDEQGPSIPPTFLSQPLKTLQEAGYPGTYASHTKLVKPKSFEEALDRTR